MFSWRKGKHFCSKVNATQLNILNRRDMEEFLSILKTSSDIFPIEALFIALQKLPKQKVSGLICWWELSCHKAEMQRGSRWLFTLWANFVFDWLASASVLMEQIPSILPGMGTRQHTFGFLFSLHSKDYLLSLFEWNSKNWEHYRDLFPIALCCHWRQGIWSHLVTRLSIVRQLYVLRSQSVPRKPNKKSNKYLHCNDCFQSCCTILGTCQLHRSSAS